jgi:hypothetical protein
VPRAKFLQMMGDFYDALGPAVKATGKA